jgi:D-alanine transaminase
MVSVPPTGRVAYVNGRYVPYSEAVVHVDDRGYQFADAVYEVLAVKAGRPYHLDQHLQRLGRSLAALAIDWPVSTGVLATIIRRVLRLNLMGDGCAYIQVSRGVAHRNHLFPADAVSSLVVTAWHQPEVAEATAEKGVVVVTAPDQRWKRPDIKSVGLLANALARQAAKEAGAVEAWLIDDRGFVTEGAATNAFIVDGDGRVVTHPEDGHILGGVTRSNVLRLAQEAGIPLIERPFTRDEALAAAEAFHTGTTLMAMPVVRIDGTPIGNGQPGPVSLRLRALYRAMRARA